jgi:hypothetical protein
MVVHMLVITELRKLRQEISKFKASPGYIRKNKGERKEGRKEGKREGGERDRERKKESNKETKKEKRKESKREGKKERERKARREGASETWLKHLSACFCKYKALCSKLNTA